MTVLYLRCEGCVLAVALVPEINSNHTEAKKITAGKTLLLLCNVCKSVGRGKERGERQIWAGGRKVQWLSETKEVCEKCQKCAEGRAESQKKEDGGKWKERSESTGRNFWRIDAAFLRWDWANSAAEPDLRCPVDGWCIRLLMPTAPASNTHFLNTTWAHFPPH